MTTMIVFVLSPLIDFLLDYIEISLHRLWYRKCVYKKVKGKKFDLLRYMDLKAGPEYPFQTRLAKTMLLVFAVVTFGPMMPLLYPIGAAGALIQYVSDKVLLVYFYRMPKQYSVKLTQSSLKAMLFTPFICLAVSFWAFSNR